MFVKKHSRDTKPEGKGPGATNNRSGSNELVQGRGEIVEPNDSERSSKAAYSASKEVETADMRAKVRTDY